MTTRRRSSPRTRTAVRVGLVIGAGSLLVVAVLTGAAALLAVVVS